MKNLSYQCFAQINLSDPFFDSLKEDYAEFSAWFQKKADAGEFAYLFESGGIQGFLYLKPEFGPVNDLIPPLPDGSHLKVGTFKINAHGTRLGQRFIKKIFDHALELGVQTAYVTAFAKHKPLLRILKTYGFVEHGTKVAGNGEEIVLVKRFSHLSGNVLKDYPIISMARPNKYLLAIYPEFHTKFLPDSKLNNESFDIVQDVSHANSIHKIYISGVAGTSKLNSGDVLVMYRTTDVAGKAYYRSVATSIGVVEETKRIDSFQTLKEFLKYVRPYSVFSAEQLAVLYSTKKRHRVIRFTYNVALRKRVIRKRLLEDVGIPGGGRRWDFLRLTDQQFSGITALGEVNESYFVD